MYLRSLMLAQMSLPERKNYLLSIVQFPAYMKCRKKSTGVDKIEIFDRKGLLGFLVELET